MQIQVSSVESTALRCAYCHDDLMVADSVRCSNCDGRICRECTSIIDRCPVWRCGAHVTPATNQIVPAVAQVFRPPPPPQPVAVAVEQTVHRAEHARAINRLWTHTMPHIAIGLIVIGIFAFTHPPIWLICLAIVAFMIMSLTDTFTQSEEES